MRFLPVLLLALLFSCSNADTPTSEVTASTEEAPATPATPYDRQLTGDADLDPIRTEYARIEDLLQGGMLQQENVEYHCDKINGVIELHRENDQVVLAINKYKDGDQITITDRWYLSNSNLIFQLSESDSWQLDGPMMTDSNGNQIPGVRNTNAQYRYYVKDGATFKFLKKTYDFFTHKVDNVNPDTLPFEEMTVPTSLPFKYALLKEVLENGKVNCSFFTSVE